MKISKIPYLFKPISLWSISNFAGGSDDIKSPAYNVWEIQVQSLGQEDSLERGNGNPLKFCLHPRPAKQLLPKGAGGPRRATLCSRSEVLWRRHPHPS